MMQAVSTGGPEHYYHSKGKNRFEIRELLNPFNQTAYLCGMAYLEPFAIFLGRRIPEADLVQRVEKYRDLIIDLRDGKIAPLKNIALNYSLPANFILKKA